MSGAASKRSFKTVKRDDEVKEHKLEWIPCGNSSQGRALTQLQQFFRTPGPLAPLTILVGPSGIGKSDIVRRAWLTVHGTRPWIDLEETLSYTSRQVNILDGADGQEWRDRKENSWLNKFLGAWNRDGRTGHVLLICNEIGHAGKGVKKHLAKYFRASTSSSAKSNKKKNKGKKGIQELPMPHIIYMNPPTAQEIRTFLLYWNACDRDTADKVAVQCAGDLRQAQFLLEQGQLMGNCHRDMSPFALASRVLAWPSKKSWNADDPMSIEASAHNLADGGFLRGLLVHSFRGSDLEAYGALLDAACDTTIADIFLASHKGSEDTEVGTELTRALFDNVLRCATKSGGGNGGAHAQINMPPRPPRRTQAQVVGHVVPGALSESECISLGPTSLLDYRMYCGMFKFDS